MIADSERNHVALLVGAGLSKSAGLPISVELANTFKTHIEQIADGSRAPTLLRFLHYYIEGGIRLQRAKLGNDPSWSVNIEEIAIAARRLQERERNPLAPFVSSWHPHLIEMLQRQVDLLDRFMDAVFDHLLEQLRTPPPEKIAFLDRLADIAVDNHGLDIFSLNYDLCIETALCERRDIRVTDGFDASGWNPSLLRDAGPNMIRLFKVHGSLNWVHSAEAGVVSTAWLDDEKKAELYGLRPHLVFGTDAKLTGLQPFFSLAHEFFECLCKAKLLVVIGYGFADDYINSLINQSLRLNRSLRLLVIDPYVDQLALLQPQLIGTNPETITEKSTAREVLENHKLKKLIHQCCTVSEGTPF